MKHALITVLFAMLAACGGAPGDNPNYQPPGSPPPDPQSANGLWSGTFTDAGEDYDVTALLYNGDLYAMSEAAGVTYLGQYSIDNNKIAGTFTGYQISGGQVSSGTIAGDVVYQEQITADFAGNTGAGSLQLWYDERSARAASLALIAGTWTYSEGGYQVSIAIDNDGQFTGQDDTGCGYSGRVSVPDGQLNLYRLELTVEACGALDGNYTGFGGLFDNMGTNDSLQTVVSNEDALFIYPFQRQ